MAAISAGDIGDEHWFAGGVRLDRRIGGGYGGLLREQVFEFAEPQAITMETNEAVNVIEKLETEIGRVARVVAGPQVRGASADDKLAGNRERHRVAGVVKNVQAFAGQRRN